MNEYVNEISKIPLLTDNETIELINNMQNGDEEARKNLIKHNLRIVVKIAYKFQSRIDLPIEDLISIGSFGLIKAIDNFDISRNVKLSTVAYLYIENTFKRHIYLSKMQKRDNSNDISLQAKIYENKDGDGITLEESIEDDGSSIEEIILQTIRDERIKNILKRLTKDEQKLLLMRYGIIDGINYTLEDIAQVQGVTRERIRQKEAKALKKLKHPQITRQIKDFFEE
ncbi:MAG: sigma-70 family RNA polymerase sigma factor [Bacilli bacterium]